MQCAVQTLLGRPVLLLFKRPAYFILQPHCPGKANIIASIAPVHYGSSRLPMAVVLAAKRNPASVNVNANDGDGKPKRAYSGIGAYGVKLPKGFVWDSTPCTDEEWEGRPVGWTIKGKRTLQYQRGVTIDGKRTKVYLASVTRPDEVGPEPTRGDVEIVNIATKQAAAYLQSLDRRQAPLLTVGILKQLEQYSQTAGGASLLREGVNATEDAGTMDAPAGTALAPPAAQSEPEQYGTMYPGSFKFTLPDSFVWDHTPISAEEWASRPTGWRVNDGLLLEFHMRPSPGANFYLGSIRRPDELRGAAATRGDLEAVRLVFTQGEEYERTGSMASAPIWPVDSLTRLDLYLASGRSLVKAGRRKARQVQKAARASRPPQ